MPNVVARDLSRSIRDWAIGIDLPKILVTFEYGTVLGGCRTLSKNARWERPM